MKPKFGCILLLLISAFIVPARGDMIEKFENDTLSPEWQDVSDSNAKGTYRVSGSKLVVSDVSLWAQGTYMSNFMLRRNIDPLGDFKAEFEFHWNMTSPVNNTEVENNKAALRILLRLLDDEKNTIAEVGFEDMIYVFAGALGNLVADVNVTSKDPKYAYSYKSANSLVSGGARFQITRKDDKIAICLGDDPVAVVNGTNSKKVSSVELVFGRASFMNTKDMFFGEATIDQVSIVGTAPKAETQPAEKP